MRRRYGSYVKTGDTERVIPSASPDRVAAESGPPLPAWKAFAVQFSHQSGDGAGVFAGRIEHLHSGRRTSFTSRQELLSKLEHMLDGIKKPL